MSGEYYLDQIKKCVTFVFDLSEKPLGTGFFASIKLEKGGYAVYFVTAKHVVQDKFGKYLENIYIRLNLGSSDSERMGLPITYVPDYILTHDDDNIDLVAYLLNPPTDRFDYLHIPQEYFTDSNILQERNIREGSNVFLAGLFYKFAKQERNHPVVRFGKIALMTEPTKLAHVYIVECQSIGAFSGSPVFFEVERITSKQAFSSPEIYLGGIIKGHYNDIIENPSGYAREINAGLALVTPCYLLNELLHTKKAKEQRERIITENMKSRE
jgi:hypothetical protein